MELWRRDGGVPSGSLEGRGSVDGNLMCTLKFLVQKKQRR